MSRSRKKAWVTISKVWNKFKEHSFRHKIRRACREAEMNFDPDADFLELTTNNKKEGSWGTKCGWSLPPKENDPTWYHEEYKRLQRK